MDQLRTKFEQVVKAAAGALLNDGTIDYDSVYRKWHGKLMAKVVVFKCKGLGICVAPPDDEMGVRYVEFFVGEEVLLDAVEQDAVSGVIESALFQAIKMEGMLAPQLPGKGSTMMISTDVDMWMWWDVDRGAMGILARFSGKRKKIGRHNGSQEESG